MVPCSNPIFVILGQSKAARFVSVPVLSTVARCECKKEDMYHLLKRKRPEI